MSINFITIHNMNDFKQIIESPIFISGNKISLDIEMSTNMWAISIVPQLLNSTSIDNLLEFLTFLLLNKTKQVSQLNISCPVIFYMWFDEMAGQLRFNIISDTNKKLPFSCQLNIVELPHSILKNFLQSQYNPEIPWQDLEEITEESEDDNWDDGEESIFILDVFVVQLNDIKQ